VFEGCEALEAVFIYAEFPPKLANVSAFPATNINGTFVVYVPEGSIKIYQAAAIWSTLPWKTTNILSLEDFKEEVEVE
jgi:hypothetical protein